MFKIGEFSRLAQVSSRLLRHYDDLGLLKPAQIDAGSGYRFYRASQLSELNRILVLRELGFSLDQIKLLVQTPPSPDHLRTMLNRRRAEVEQDLAVQAQRLKHLEQRIADLEQGEQVPLLDVLFRPVPGCRLLAARATFGSFDDARNFVMTLHHEVPRLVGRKHLGRMIAIQFAQEYEPDALDVEFGFTVHDDFELTQPPTVAGKPLAVRNLPPLESAAICVRVGPPDQAHRQFQAIARRLEVAGLVLAGPNREVFLTSPSRHEPPAIEMQFPVRRAATGPPIAEI